MLALFLGAGIFFVLLVGRPIPLPWIGKIVRALCCSASGMVHIGKQIETELRRQERSVAWFARNLYCERTNVYDIFKRKSIDTELLLRISIILRHDFFRYYRDELSAGTTLRHS